MNAPYMTGMLEGVCRINVVSSLVTQSLFTIEADIRLIEINQSQNLSLQNCFSTLNSRRPLKTDDDPCMSPVLEYDYWFCCASELGPPRI